MKTFKIKNGDLSIDKSGNIEMVDGEHEIAQSVEMILSTSKGEWFLDGDFGLSYDEITGKGQRRKDIEHALREAVYQDERIQGVDFKSIEVDGVKRTLTVGMELTTVDDDSLIMEVSV